MCKNYQTCRGSYSWNPSACICENGKYLGRLINNLPIRCDEIINAVGDASKTDTSTVSTNIYEENIRCKMVCYIFNTVLLVITVLLIIAIICCHYEKHRSKKNRLMH